ncbi:MAG TPA: fibronectin type III domain-containing protein [Jatrophihabitans sp.]
MTTNPAVPDDGVGCTVAGDSGSCVITGLIDGFDYTFYAIANNAAGSSQPSRASNTITAQNPPGAPGKPSAVNDGARGVRITVAPPESGPPPSFYTVTAHPGGATCTVSGRYGSCRIAGQGTCAPDAPADGCLAKVLRYGTKYTFTSTATYEGRTSATSAPSDSFELTERPATPAPPTVIFAGSTWAVLSVVPNVSGGGATSYTITSDPGGKTCSVHSSAGGQCRVDGLLTGTKYRFRVTASGLGGDSSPSSPSRIVIAQAPPAVPDAPSAVAGDSSAEVTVTASSSGGGVPDSYKIVAHPGGHTCTVTGASGSCLLTGLTNGTAYTFTAAATNDSGTSTSSAASKSVTPHGAPNPPAAPIAVAGDGWAVVTVKPSPTGEPVQSYIVTAQPGGQSCTITVPAKTCLFPELVNDTAYTFTATASNADGTSDASEPSNSVTPQGPPGVPGAPSAIGGDSSARVTVTPAAGGGSATSYTVTASPGGQTCTVTGDHGGCQVTGLTNGTAYTFTATATNAAGTSAASAPSNSVVVMPVRRVDPGAPARPLAGSQASGPSNSGAGSVGAAGVAGSAGAAGSAGVDGRTKGGQTKPKVPAPSAGTSTTTAPARKG